MGRADEGRLDRPSDQVFHLFRDQSRRLGLYGHSRRRQIRQKIEPDVSH